MPKTTSEYSVGNIVAIIVCMLVAVGMTLWTVFGDHSPRFDGVFWKVLFAVSAVAMGWVAIRAIRSRRH